MRAAQLAADRRAFAAMVAVTGAKAAAGLVAVGTVVVGARGGTCGPVAVNVVAVLG